MPPVAAVTVERWSSPQSMTAVKSPAAPPGFSSVKPATVPEKGIVAVAETVRPVEAQRLAEIVDRRLLFVGDVLVFRHPEEIRRHQPRERGAVLVLGDISELLAEGLETGIVHARRQRDGHRLVGSERRLWRLGRWLRRLYLRHELGHARHGCERARDYERCRNEKGGGEA